MSNNIDELSKKIQHDVKRLAALKVMEQEVPEEPSCDAVRLRWMASNGRVHSIFAWRMPQGWRTLSDYMVMQREPLSWNELLSKFCDANDRIPYAISYYREMDGSMFIGEDTE